MARKDQWEEIFNEQYEALSSGDIGQIEKFVGRLEKIKKKMFSMDVDLALNPSHWQELQALADTHFSSELLESLNELDSLVDDLIGETEGWASDIRAYGNATRDLPKGWYYVDDHMYDTAVQQMNDYIKWFSEIADGVY